MAKTEFIETAKKYYHIYIASFIAWAVIYLLLPFHSVILSAILVTYIALLAELTLGANLRDLLGTYKHKEQFEGPNKLFDIWKLVYEYWHVHAIIYVAVFFVALFLAHFFA